MRIQSSKFIDVELLKETEGKLFIGGKWVKASNGKIINVYNPATDELVGSVGDASEEDINLATDYAEKAFNSWKKLSYRKRADILHKVYLLIHEYKDSLAQIITLENGKPLLESYGEINYAADFVQWFAEEAKRSYGETIPANTEDKRIIVIRQPVGVVGAITPWNFPAAMITRKIAPALAAGCTTIIKPAKQTPLTAAALCQIFKEAGVPDGVINMITTVRASTVSNLWMKDHRIRKVTFTGSTEVGKILMRQAADQVKKLSLELGGHAPLIVFDDADVETAVRGTINSKFRCSGQACIASNRIYVQDGIYEKFLKRFVEEVSKLKVGSGLESDVQIGPILDNTGFEKIIEQIDDAESKGAKILTGKSNLKQSSGKFIQPVVLEDVTEEMDIMHEETFGPVAPIIRFSDEEEAVKSANNTRYGLASYIFSSSMDRCIRVSEQLDFGIVGINDGLPSAAQSPFGGIKESGLGREGSRHGLYEYQELKYLSIGLSSTN